MAFVLIYLKDMMAIHTSAYARTVSICVRFTFFHSLFFSLSFYSCIYFTFTPMGVVVVRGGGADIALRRNCSHSSRISTSFILILILFVPYWWIQINSNTHIDIIPIYASETKTKNKWIAQMNLKFAITQPALYYFIFYLSLHFSVCFLFVFSSVLALLHFHMPLFFMFLNDIVDWEQCYRLFFGLFTHASSNFLIFSTTKSFIKKFHR